MKYAVLSREAHGGKRVLPLSSFAFARTWSLAPLCGAELAKAALEFPIGFAVEAGAVVPVALLFPEPGNNAYLNAQGQWLCEYVPAVFRAYPFALATVEGGSDRVIVVDEEAAVLSDSEGEPLFTEAGEPASALLNVRNFFLELERSRQATLVACAALAKYQLLTQWPLKIEKAPGEVTAAGHTLLRLDETAFNALSPEAVAELWQAGAFPVAYTHLLSVGRLATLGRLSAPHFRPQPPAPAVPAAPLDLDQVFGIASEDQGFQLHF